MEVRGLRRKNEGRLKTEVRGQRTEDRGQGDEKNKKVRRSGASRLEVWALRAV